MSRAVDLTVYCGHSRLPTMLRSVLPGPGKSVCVWRQRMARWPPRSPAKSNGNRNSWMTNSLAKNKVPGKFPPQTANANQTPTKGIDSTIENTTRRPEPESRSSGSE